MLATMADALITALSMLATVHEAEGCLPGVYGDAEANLRQIQAVLERNHVTLPHTVQVLFDTVERGH
jgi:hypothetical protein